MKFKKGILKIGVMFVLLYLVCSTCIFATLGSGFNENLYNQVANEGNTTLDNTISKIGSTIFLVLQIAAICGVVYTGVRYMYASSNDKAKIKETLIWLIVGTIFVFAAPAIIDFITRASNNILSNNQISSLLQK